MSFILRFARVAFALVTAIIALFAFAAEANAAEKAIYYFKDLPDGFGPNGLISDRAGDLFGTTRYGGDLKSCNGQGCGTLYELVPPAGPGQRWTKNTLHVFTNNGLDGYWPSATLLIDKLGNLFGVTEYGGTNNAGLVYELSAPSAPGGQWTESSLFDFSYANRGATGYGAFGLVFDRGTLYGTTFAGGKFDGGAVFKLQPPARKGQSWRESLLHSFPLWHDGTNNSPGGSLAVDKYGNLYGTRDGDYVVCQYNYNNCGAVFRLLRPAQPNDVWDYEVLHRFTGYGDGFFPNDGLTFDGAGDIFGTTWGAGGTVFELIPPARRGGTWSETIIDSFQNFQMNGQTPLGPVTFDESGDLLGTTSAGGTYGAGTVFQLQPPSQPGGVWTETVLFEFPGGVGGGTPQGPLTFGRWGYLFGTAGSGGYGCPKFSPTGCGDVFSLGSQ